MLGGAASPGGDDLLTVTVVRDEHGYGMKVSGDNPVYVQSVKEHGAAWRAGLRAGDRILRVESVPVHHHTHQQVVHMIRANPTTVLTVQQNTSRHKTPITAPVPVNLEKQRQLEASKVHTVRLMLEQEQKFIKDLKNELSKVPDVRKQAQLESAEQRCSKLQHEIDTITAGQPDAHAQLSPPPAPSTPRLNTRTKTNLDKTPTTPTPNTGFLSGLPRSLSNLTGQSLRNLRQARQNNKNQQENQPPLVRQNSDETNNKRRHVHNNTVPMVPTTCLDNVTPPPLPPRSIERPKRNPLSPTMSPPPINPLAKPKPCNSASQSHKQYYKYHPYSPDVMHQSMPSYNDDHKQFRRSSHSLDGELDGPQPNSIALQMSYPLVNVPPPPLQMDNRTGVPVLHVRSRSSPEQLDHNLARSMCSHSASPVHTLLASPQPHLPHPHASPHPPLHKEWGERDTPPPGTPPPPYHTNTQPCSDPQRAIISMEEDDSPASDASPYSGLFSSVRAVRESRARTAVLLNWLLAERRCACACLLLVLTDGYRGASGVQTLTLRRWAYEIHSTFLVPDAALQLSGVDENMANEIEHVLVNEFDKEELVRNVFRKARQKAKDELSQQLAEFQVKRQVGLGSLYAPDDAVIDKCDVDKAQELIVVEQLLCQQLRSVARGGPAACARAPAPAPAPASAEPGAGAGAGGPLLAALLAAALCLHCRPASVAAAVGGQRASFLQRDKIYKQRLKQTIKQQPQPFVVRGHHLQLQALTALAHCHHCGLAICGLAPQAYVCTDCKLYVHCACARGVDESCCLDGEHHHNRISRFMERIHANNQPYNQDSSDKKSRKSSGAGHFLNMERSFRKTEDEPPWDQTLTPVIERRDESDESLYESADGHSDAISASDDALPRLGRTPTISKESLKLAVTDEEVDLAKTSKKGHRKTMSLSYPLEFVRTLGDELMESAKRELEKNCDKKKSRESLWSEEDRESIHGSTMKLDQIRKNSKKEDKSQSSSRKSSTNDPPKSRKTSKGSSVGALSFLRRKKTSTANSKPVESVAENENSISALEIINYTRLFLEGEKRFASICDSRPPVETDSEEEPPTAKQIAEHRRRLSRQTSRSKSKARGKSQSLKVNTLRKSHSGTLKKGKKKSVKTPSIGRSRQASLVEQTPIAKKKTSDSMKQNSWLFSGSRGESRREGSTDEPTALDADVDTSDANSKEPDKDNNWRSPAGHGGGRGVNRAESCRERDAPRRGKHRNASDPNRLTAHNNHDLEPGAATAPSGSSSSSSLSSRSNESNTVAAEQQASQSDWSEEEEPLAAQWAESLPPQVLDSLVLCARLRKRQEVIHELIVSEGSHVRWLRVLSSVFLRPLERHALLLAPDELRALFPNLPAVRERHGRLYSELRAARAAAPAHLVRIRPLADAVLNTLGESGYASCVSKFCRGQRMALEALRERRRKSKELHAFLASKEQLPICGRLQLRDMLACVWQRLTKYQLLLEGILKTVADSDSESDEDVARLRRALDVAKDVLHRVDTAIRTAENEHRLRSIQSKLEVRAPAEWEELRRLELAQHELRLEGELTLRHDSTKRVNVLALMLDDCLVLLQRESDKFVLKPIPQPSHSLMLSPLIKWDKVLFRANAAVRNTFFLMNINGVQMHELSANSGPEYATWVKYIQEAPLAKLTELKSSITPSHQPSRSTDDSGINVSRNPSDASEKSSSTAPDEAASVERASAERSSAEPEPEPEESREDKREPSLEEERQEEPEKEVAEKQETHKPRRPTVGRISTHGAEPAAALEPRRALTVSAPAAAAARTATRVYTHQERLRRLDEVIGRCLRAKSGIVAELLGVPPQSFAQVADLAVAETLGQVDVCSELAASRAALSRSSSEEDPAVPAHPAQPAQPAQPDVHQLLLAAHTQATQLIRSLQRALNVNEAAAVAARATGGGAGRCDACRRRPRAAPAAPAATAATAAARSVDTESFEHIERPEDAEWEADRLRGVDAVLERAESFEALTAADPALLDAGLPGDSADLPLDGGMSCAALAAQLAGAAGGVQAALRRLLAAAPAPAADQLLREQLAALREQNDALRARHAAGTDYQMTDEIPFSKAGADPSIQDQPSNGG